MTVRDLTELLAHQDQDAEVFFFDQSSADPEACLVPLGYVDVDTFHTEMDDTHSRGVILCQTDAFQSLD